MKMFGNPKVKINMILQALMVSDELIRVAILWHEQWHEGLEEASRHEVFEPFLG